MLRHHDDRPGWRIFGNLDDPCGESLFALLKAAQATDPDNVTDTAAAADARAQGEDGCARRRTKAQRLHDAFALVLTKTLAAGALGTRGKQPVQIGVTVPLAALHQAPGALPARTDSGYTIAGSVVRRWLCDSAITRFVLGLGNRVIEVSHTERTVKPHERRIKQLETDGICQGAGCGRGDPTGDVLIPHHPTPYAECGATSLTETVMLCRHTHADLHVGGKTIRLKDGRLLNEHGWVT